MKKFLLALFVFILTGMPLCAQAPVVKSLLRTSVQVEKTVANASRLTTLPSIKPLLKTTLPLRTPTPLVVPSTIRHSVFTVQATPLSKHKGSAFAINIDGRVWGVTARHVMDDIDHTPYMTFLGENNEPVTLLATPSKEGSAAGADVALFEIPPQALPYLQPLELEEELPATHQVLFSSGFAHGNFLSQPAREVLFASEHRILTKYVSFNSQESGYCGSPLMRNGKVAGIHVGSMLEEQLQTAEWYKGTVGQFDEKMHNISLAVPANWLRRLARQAEGVYTPQEGVPLVFNGLPIMHLQPTDSIGFIMQLRGGRVIKKLSRYPFMDFTHLENFFNVLPGDMFRMEVMSKNYAPKIQTYWYEWIDGESDVIKTLKR